MNTPSYDAIYPLLLRIEGLTNLSMHIGLDTSYLLCPNDMVKDEVVRYFNHKYTDYVIDLSTIIPESKNCWIFQTPHANYVFMMEGLYQFDKVYRVLTDGDVWDLSFLVRLHYRQVKFQYGWKVACFLKQKRQLMKLLKPIDGMILPITYVMFEYKMEFNGHTEYGKTPFCRIEWPQVESSIRHSYDQVVAIWRNLIIQYEPKSVDITMYGEFPLVSERWVQYKIRGEIDVAELSEDSVN